MPVAASRVGRLRRPAQLRAAFAAASLGVLFGLVLAAAEGTGSDPPAPSLQPWIDATPSGGILQLPAGTYSGPVLISRPILIDGRGEVTIDGGGKGTVVTVRTTGVVLRRLHLRNSGDSHDRIDSGVLVEDGQHNLIEDNRIDEVLFGITLQQANDNRIVGNRIRSLALAPADRGDGIRLWYSMSNRIERNELRGVRDITVSNSLRNRFVGNSVHDSRRAMNLLFAHRTLIEGNHLRDNSSGITALNSDGLVIRRNQILHAIDASGAGVALKESGTTLLHDNEIIHCAVGILSDSPRHAINRMAVIDNRIAHNVTGISFYGERGGHLVLRNRFEHNLWPALVGAGDSDDANQWWGNYWDGYQGFDLDDDGIGDTPHEVWAHADRIWMETPMAAFFRNAPALEMLDFLERLAPFAPPTLMLRDPEPLSRQPVRGSGR